MYMQKSIHKIQDLFLVMMLLKFWNRSGFSQHQKIFTLKK